MDALNSPTLSSMPGEWAALCRDASDAVLATLASYLKGFTNDALLLKRIELDVLRLCLARITAEHDALDVPRLSPPARTDADADWKAPTLPSELIVHILSLAHPDNELYLLHLCSGGTDPATRAFARTLHALAPLPPMRRMLLARATARVGLHAHADLPVVLALTAPLRLAVLFGVRDERRAPTELATRSALPALLEHADRWREVRVEGWDAAADVAFLRACAPALPFVRHLQFLVHSAPSDRDDADNEAIATILADAEVQRLTSAHVSAQYLPGFVASGAFARVYALTVHVTARRGAASLADCLAPLATLDALESLEIVEEGYGYGAFGAGAAASPVEALASASTSTPDSEQELLRIRSLCRVRVRGCTSKGSAALARHLRACTGVDEFAMADSPAAAHASSAAWYAAGAGKDTEVKMWLAVLGAAFPRLKRLEVDWNLPALLATLASPFPQPRPSTPTNGDSVKDAPAPQWPLSHLRALALLKSVPAQLVAATLCARRAAGVPLLELAVRVRASVGGERFDAPPKRNQSGWEWVGAVRARPPAVEVMRDGTNAYKDAQVDDARALEAFVPHLVCFTR